MNPCCSRRKKPFSSRRGLALHTVQSPRCCNYVCRNQILSANNNQRNQVLNNVQEIAQVTTDTQLSSINVTNTFSEDTHNNAALNIETNENYFGDDDIMEDIDDNVNENKWTIVLLKILDDMNAPDYAFKKIIGWAHEAKQHGYSFQPPGGLTRKNNIAYFRKKIFQSEKLLPKIETVNLPHGPPSEIVTFDFVPQLLSLLQNRSLMTAANLAIDINKPLQPFKSVNKCLNEALSGSVYKAAYPKFVRDPTTDFFVPIIQWIDRTHITGNERFSLKPYMFTPAIFKEECRRKIEFWGYHGFIPKRKDTQAETRLRKPGDNLRNYHAELKVVLSSFKSSAQQLKNVVLPIGPGPNPQMIVNVIPCILCIIQDMQEGDMLCGRFGPHTPEIQRQCRACDINYDNLDNPNIICKRLYASTMHTIATNSTIDYRKRWSQHQLENAFIEMPLADPVYGIFGATPVDTMHAFRKGIIESTTCFIIDQLSIGQKTMLDQMAINFNYNHAQTCRKEYPMMNLSSSITGLTKISASERVGLLFLMVILANIDRGSAIFEAAFALKDNGKTVQDIIEVLEALLTFDAWLNQDSYWALQNATRYMRSAQNSIQALLQLCKECFPHHKWQFPKFHEMLHIINDMERFGATKNFSAQRPESLLIHAAKRPGRRARKIQSGAAYDVQAANRVIESFFIKKFNQEYHKDITPCLEDDNNNSVTICNSTGRGTFGFASYDHLTKKYSIQWQTKSKANEQSMELPQDLLKHVVEQFGNPVTVCTEFRRDSLIFRCHPKFQSSLPKYDWMNVCFDTGIFPCRLALVVINECEETGIKEYQLIVQSTTSKTNHPQCNGSVLFTEWNWSSAYLSILPENIVGHCFVVTNLEHPSRVLETLPYCEWAQQFTS